MLPPQPDGDDRPILRERGLMDILGETFSIYGARVVPIIIISTVAHFPIIILSAIPSESSAFLTLVAFVGGAMPAFAYAAIIAAVGFSAIGGRVSPARCYGRVAWRGLSVLAFAVLYGALSAGAIFALDPFAAWGAELSALADAAESPEELELPPFPTVAALSLLAMTAASILISIYMTTIAPSVMIEGRKGFGAVARGVQLARGSEWRIVGHVIVYVIVLILLMIALVIPFAIIGGLFGGGGDSAQAAANPLVEIGVLSAQISVQPIIYIATTLLYFDIRLKKEDYGAARLSEEMGGAGVGDDRLQT